MKGAENGLRAQTFLVSTAKAGSLAAALGSAGIYERVDQVQGRAVRVADGTAAASLAPEQHLMNLQIIPVNFRVSSRAAMAR